MAIVIASITVAQAATIINAIITFLQYSLGLALVALLLYFLPPTNSANSWSIAARQVHTSLWPTILRCDSAASSLASTRINFFSKLSLFSALLVAICGIVTPLGLKQGTTVHSNFHPADASFVGDSSPLGLSTSPRQEFKFSRVCGALGQVICPGNTPDTINRTEIPPSVLETFSSTPHGPFNMQFRRYFTGTSGYNFSVTKAQIGVVQSIILSDKIFAAEGLIIDTGDSPGIGLLNHTLPSLKGGVTWSQEALWLEPVTNCVDTNLTIDYVLTSEFGIDRFNLTDRGGFVNLTTVYPISSRDGQNIDLHQHAYKGAVLSNRFAMIAFNNMTRNESYIGKPYPLNKTDMMFHVGDMSTMKLKYVSNATLMSLDTSCRGFGGADNANISNVGVQCGMFVGPARRTDGGDERIPSLNSTWSQTLHTCASATRASIQTVTFAINSTKKELGNLQITRTPSNTPVLWAVEKTDLDIANVNLFWGHVLDKYESDPSLWTIRSNTLYVPAGSADIFGLTVSGQPSTVPAMAWSKVYETSILSDFDYSGKNNYALLTKWQSLLAKDPELGHAQIRNLIWTDIVANSLVGVETQSTLSVASLKPSVTYDLRYGIPLLVLLIIWMPSFVALVFVLLLGLLKVSHIRNIINHTAVGRLALGHSALAAADGTYTVSEPIHPNEKDWVKTVGKTNVSLRSVVTVQRSENGIIYDTLPKSFE